MSTSPSAKKVPLLSEDALGQVLHGHAGAGGLRGEILGIDLVEGGEIAHVGQEAGGLEHLVEAGAGGFQDGAHVLAALLRLGGDAGGHLAGGGVHGDLAGGIDKTVHFKTLGIGTDGAGGVLGFQNFHVDSLLFVFDTSTLIQRMEKSKGRREKIFEK